MKKLLSLILTLALVLGSLGALNVALAEQTTLTYWQHSSEARNLMMDSLIAEFTAANPDITILTEYIPFGDYPTKLIPSLATDTGPDVFQIQSGMVRKLAEVGSIQPLDAAVMPYDQIENDFIPSTIQGLLYEGKYYGMPTDLQTIITIWNKDIVAEAGLDAEAGPASWDEFFDWARKLTVNENGQLTRSGWGTNGYWPEVQAYVEAVGGKFYDAEQNAFVFADDETSVKAVEDMANLYRNDKVYNVEFGATWASFRQGLVGIMLGHPAMIGNLATTAPDVNIGVGLIPGNAQGKHVTAVSSWAYVASSRAPSDAATRFINFLGSEAVEKRWTLTTGELPARKALLTDEELNANPKVATAIASLNDSVLGGLQLASLNTIWSENWQRIQLTEDSVADILRDAQEALNAELVAP